MTDLEIKGVAEKLLKRDFGDTRIIDAPCVIAEREVKSEIAGGSNIPQKLRALSLLALKDGNFRISQEPKFDRLGVWLDVSRGGVMRVERLKEYMERVALYGANYVMLYMEDIFNIPEYPHFGYLRGAYSDEELREIDDYAYSLGLELIPAVQTLSHMRQYLSWAVPEETVPLADTESTLLCGAPETERFIDAMIKKLKSVLRTDKIHLGMDEAFDLGFGQYFKRNGYVDRYEIFSKHYKMVAEKCKKYGFEPMLWSDTFFRLASQSGNYEFGEFQLPQNEKVAKDLEEYSYLTLVYGDYYQEEKETYDWKFKVHAQMHDKIVFAGGLWTWGNVLIDYEKCFKTMIPAMQSCIEHGIRDVFACCWGDDGCETDYFRAIYSFAIFSEYCYCETEPSEEHIRAMGELVSGISTETVLKVGKFQPLPEQKKIYSGDIFYNATSLDYSKQPHHKICAEMAEKFEKGEDEYARLLFKISAIKTYVYEKMQPDYKAGKDLSVYEKDILPELLESYRLLKEVHSNRWLEVNKAYGYEIIASRYAMLIARTEYAIDKIGKYNRGEIENIEELDYTPVYGNLRSNAFHKTAFGATLPIS